jgi:hypothetical protein
MLDLDRLQDIDRALIALLQKKVPKASTLQPEAKAA